jgi:ferredoxin
MAEAGIESIRIGTKELAFNPQRFDDNFWKMMDLFHKQYPKVKLQIVGHYSHPYELVSAKIDSKGRYLYDTELEYDVRKDLEKPLCDIDLRKGWIRHRNQFPIIAGINDSAAVISLLMKKCDKLGIEMHNIYACREIPGNAYFRAGNDIIEQYRLVKQAKSKLSGMENHGRLIMSTEYGKMEVVGVDGSNVILEFNRFIHGKVPEQTTVVVDISKLPEGQKFYWLTDEVIDCAVNGRGQKVLKQLRSDDDSFIATLKKAAAASVLGQIPQNDNVEPEVSSCSQQKLKKVVIEVVNRNGGSKILEIDLGDKEYEKKQPTLATVLKKEGEVEAACEEQLSCSTCVGEVESDQPLKSPTDDEKDLIDSAMPKGAIKAESVTDLRATCQIILEPGKTYKFTSLSELNLKNVQR